MGPDVWRNPDYYKNKYPKIKKWFWSFENQAKADLSAFQLRSNSTNRNLIQRLQNILLIVGSVFGAAHAVADDVGQRLSELDLKVTRNESPEASDLEAQEPDLLLVITSTTGSGDLPEELVPFYSQLQDTPPRIAGLRFTVIVLGDSSYGETFCGGGLALDAALEDIGAQRVAGPLQIDAIETDEPETIALDFINELLPSLQNQ